MIMAKEPVFVFHYFVNVCYCPHISLKPNAFKTESATAMCNIIINLFAIFVKGSISQFS